MALDRRNYRQLVDTTVELAQKVKTLNPQPSTLNPQPSTLNPQPSTLQGYLAHKKQPLP